MSAIPRLECDLGSGVEIDMFTVLLPELWTEILRHVPEVDRLCSVPLVSRSFKEASQHPSLWEDLHVTQPSLGTEARWLSFLRWMQCRVLGLQKLVIGCMPEWEISVEVAKQAAYWEPYLPKLITILADSAPQLRSLEYSYPCHAPSSSASALPVALGRMSQLTSLTLDVGRVIVKSAQVNEMVKGLASLKRFTLRGVWYHLLPNGFPLGIVHSCKQLQELTISGASLSDVPAAIGDLTALTRLELSGAGVTSLPDSISRLTALRELDIQENRDPNLPAGLTACEQLTLLAMGLDIMCPALASLSSLRDLRIETVQLFSGIQPNFVHLKGLENLHLSCQSYIPAGLGMMTNLRKLTIRSPAIGSFPPGPYLSRLESLTLKHSRANLEIPTYLAAALQLQHLTLETFGAINVSDADVDVLLSMTSLTHLTLKQGAAASKRNWNACFADLRSRCALEGREPPTISA